ARHENGSSSDALSEARDGGRGVGEGKERPPFPHPPPLLFCAVVRAGAYLTAAGRCLGEAGAEGCTSSLVTCPCYFIVYSNISSRTLRSPPGETRRRGYCHRDIRCHRRSVPRGRSPDERD